MFVSQKVFCRTESIFNLNTVAEVHKDTIRLIDGTTVSNDSIIPTLSSKMCELSKYKMHNSAQFIQQGVLLKQEHGVITVLRPNNSVIASFRNICTSYDSYAADLSRKKLVVFDTIKNSFITMAFNTQKQQEYELNYEIVRDWSIIYKTPYILYWSATRCSVLNTEDETISPLIKQTEQITSVRASSQGDVCLIGDKKGYVNIWYTSNWDRHHRLQVGNAEITEIDINLEKKAAVCTNRTFAVIDIVSGTILFNRDSYLKHICILDDIVIGSMKEKIMVFSAHDGVGINTIQMQSPIKHIASSVKRRCWIYMRENRIELRFNADILEWPQKCFDWIHSPELPLENDSLLCNTVCLDILSRTVDMWLPRLHHFKFPTKWLKYGPICESIWSTLFCLDLEFIDFGFIYKQFCQTSIRKKWLKACEDFLYLKTSNSFEWNMNVICILEHISLNGLDLSLKRWCWFHHGRKRCRPILLNITVSERNTEFIEFIQNDKITPDAILCISEPAIKRWIQAGYYCVILKMLKTYHEHYVFAFTPQTKSVFSDILHYCLQYTGEIDIPSEKNGKWIKKNIRTLKTGNFVRENTYSKGVITQICPELRWQPLNKNTDILWHHSSKEIDCWSSNNKELVNIMDCYIFLLQEEYWCALSKHQPWKWFESEIGAHLSIGLVIYVYEQPMKIIEAEYTDGVGQILTSSGTVIKQQEQLPIECKTSTFNYHQNHLRDISFLRDKICKQIAYSKRPYIVREEHCKTILDTCLDSPIQIETQWELKYTITEIVSHRRTTYIGTSVGDIIELPEFGSMFYSTNRTFKGHENPLLKLLIVKNTLWSLCPDVLCIWDLNSGHCEKRNVTDMEFVTMSYFNDKIFVVELTDNYVLVSEWDSVLNLRLKYIDSRIVIDSHSFIDMYENKLRIDDSLYTIDSQATEIQTLLIKNILQTFEEKDILYGITSDNKMFYNTNLNSVVIDYNSAAEITAMGKIEREKCFIIGRDDGRMFIWDIEKRDFGISTQILTEPIRRIFMYKSHAYVIGHKTIAFISIMANRPHVSCLTLQKMCTWSYRWKLQVIRHARDIVQPVLISSLLNHFPIENIIILLLACTEEYEHRGVWCNDEFMDILLEIQQPEIKTILRRLVTFRGRKFDCTICGDTEKLDDIVYIKNCRHYFHKKCIQQLIKKTSEHHDEMQYQYALTVSLRCPICRQNFTKSDVCSDTFINEMFKL